MKKDIPFRIPFDNLLNMADKLVGNAPRLYITTLISIGTVVATIIWSSLEVTSTVKDMSGELRGIVYSIDFMREVMWSREHQKNLIKAARDNNVIIPDLTDEQIEQVITDADKKIKHRFLLEMFENEQKIKQRQLLYEE